MSRLSRESIARAAIEIADADGVDAVSMRRVATHLGVGTMSLYHHVRDKQALYTAMADAIMQEQIIPEESFPLGWREGLAEIGRRAYVLFVAHPWILARWHDADRGQPGESFAHHVEQTLAIVAELDFLPVGERVELAGLIDEYVTGHVMHNLEDEGTEWEAYLREQAATGRYPHLAELTAGGEFEAYGGAFERGLQILLDGMERYVEARRPSASGS